MRLFEIVKQLFSYLGWKLIWGRLLSLLRKKFLSKGEKKYINGKIILIEEGREYYKETSNANPTYPSSSLLKEGQKQ